MGLGGANLGKAMKGGAKNEGGGGQEVARTDATMMAQAQVQREAEYLKKLAEHTKRMLKVRCDIPSKSLTNKAFIFKGF